MASVRHTLLEAQQRRRADSRWIGPSAGGGDGVSGGGGFAFDFDENLRLHRGEGGKQGDSRAVAGKQPSVTESGGPLPGKFSENFPKLVQVQGSSFSKSSIETTRPFVSRNFGPSPWFGERSVNHGWFGHWCALPGSGPKGVGT